MPSATSAEPIATSRPLNRFASPEAWQDPDWTRFLPRTGTVAGGAVPDIGQWERTQFLYGLERCGKLTLQSRVLVAVTMPDEAIANLSEYVGCAEVLDLSHISRRRGAEARLFWSNGGVYARDRLIVREPSSGLDDLAVAAYDAVVFPHSALFFSGTVGIARLLAQAARALTPGGIVAFKAEILSDPGPDPGYLDVALLDRDALLERFASDIGLVAEGGFDPKLPASGGFGRAHRGRTIFPSLWFLRKQNDASERGWEQMRSWMLGRLLGDQLHRLETGPAGRRDGGQIITRPNAAGTVFYGPYLALPRGRYEAVVSIEPTGSRCGPLELEVVADGKPIRSERVRFGDPSGRTVRLPFTVADPQRDLIEKVEIRARISGGAVAFTACEVNALQ
jgi:hypothetical protein